jgi:nifR3 family TIM-barrel protein
MSNFWKKLDHGFTVLAPMENVTDHVFREIMSTVLPAPDVLFTEFTAADGLNSTGREKALKKLVFSNKQRPVVAQIWGVNPKNLALAAKTCAELGFDGIDINMGCPDKAVLKIGAGAAMCTNPLLASDCIKAVQENSNGLPVSVKTRLGFNKVIINEWASILLEHNLAALTIHGRTAKQMSDHPADWEQIAKVVELRNKINPNTIIIGNGDVTSYQEGVERVRETNVDGVMIGRGVFSNPWIFEKENKSARKPEDYFEVLKKHLSLYDSFYEGRHFDVMKKFFKMYIREFDGANEIRAKLMETKNITEAVSVIDKLKLDR